MLKFPVNFSEGYALENLIPIDRFSDDSQKSSVYVDGLFVWYVGSLCCMFSPLLIAINTFMLLILFSVIWLLAAKVLRFG